MSLLKDFGIVIPPQWAAAPYDHVAPTDAGWNVWRIFTEGWTATGAVLNVPAMLIVGIVTILLIVGIKESTRFNNVIVVLKLAVILAFIGFGAAYVNADNWQPFVPPAEGDGRFGWGGVLRGAGVIFFAYIGFDAVSTAAQEAKNPQRDMPIGILGSLAVCTVLYVAVALVLTGIVDFRQLDVPDPIAVGIDAAGPDLAWLRPIVKIGAVAGLSSVILVMLLGQPRIFYSMARDGLLPRIFGDGAPALPHAVGGIARNRRRGDARRGPLPDRTARRAGLDRHAAGVRDRVRRRARAPLHRPADPPPVPRALRALRPDRGRAGVRLPDGRPAARHLGAPARLDGPRHRHLLRLRPPPLATRRSLRHRTPWWGAGESNPEPAG